MKFTEFKHPRQKFAIVYVSPADIFKVFLIPAVILITNTSLPEEKGFFYEISVLLLAGLLVFSLTIHFFLGEKLSKSIKKGLTIFLIYTFLTFIWLIIERVYFTAPYNVSEFLFHVLFISALSVGGSFMASLIAAGYNMLPKGALDLGITIEVEEFKKTIFEQDKDKIYNQVVETHAEVEIIKREINAIKRGPTGDDQQIKSWVDAAADMRRTESVQAARELLKQAEAMFPENATIQFNLGCYSCLLGDIEEAKRRVERATELDAQFKLLALDDPDLEAMWKGIGGGNKKPLQP